MSFAMNLANWTERFSTPAERFFLGVTMTLVGLTIVLLVLSLISLMVSAISRTIRGKTDKRVIHFEGHAAESSKGKSPDLVTETAAVRAVPADEVQEAPVSLTDSSDATLVAIFAAAISAFSASSEPQTTAGFVIRRFRRV
jgi:Na+-transporting methylmalonyl-CoA/oxaloacetate decarboxylase gamma subunit